MDAPEAYERVLKIDAGNYRNHNQNRSRISNWTIVIYCTLHHSYYSGLMNTDQPPNKPILISDSEYKGGVAPAAEDKKYHGTTGVFIVHYSEGG